MKQVLVVVPTIIAHPYKHILIDQLVQDPQVAQVVVVDNGNCFEISASQQESWAKVERIRPGCNLQWLNSCNLGISMMLARQLPYVCLLNDDTSLSERFFDGLIQVFQRQPEAAAVVPQYNGKFGHQANNNKLREQWQPEDKEVEAKYIDGTCILLSRRTVETVGLLDPLFRPPGWGADVDYSYRITRAGLKMFVSCRSMLWHVHQEGGTSARTVYGDIRTYLATGMKQLRTDLETKYGKDWREKMPTPKHQFDRN